MAGAGNKASKASPQTPSTHWAQIGESSFVAGMWLLYQIHRLLGRWPCLLCLYPVVSYYWLSRPLARRSSLDYLQRMQQAHGLWPQPPGWRESLRHFRVFAQVILDKMLAIAGRYPASRVQVLGQQAVMDLIARGQGAVFITAHMGCIELSQVLAEQRAGLRLNVLVHTRHAQQFNRMLARLSPGSQVRFLQVKEFNAATAIMLAERVSAGEFIAIAGDRVPVHAGNTAQAPFLGAQAAFPTGPYVMAALLKCPLLLMTCTHAGDGYALQIETLASQVLLPRAGREQALAQYAARYAAALEARLRSAPWDWFNFFPFWAQANAPQPVTPLAQAQKSSSP